MYYSKYDVVIVGSGISGLFLANKLALSSKFRDGILLVTKSELCSGSSSLAQGGIVSVIPEINPNDSVESHIKDTLAAGCGINDLNCVKYVSEESYKVLHELTNMGVEFDRNTNNSLNFTLEAAHSCPRILHANGDSTGMIIENALCKQIEAKKNVTIYKNSMAVDLLTDKTNTARGIIIYNCDANKFEAVFSNAIVLATGGIGQIYQNTTNPIESTGDGIAIAMRAGACVENMEFVQFHPTALYTIDGKTMPLVSESVRGEGGELTDLSGNYFAKTYHHLGSLAPRDVVARSIKSQLKITGDKYVNIDISKIGVEKFKKRFPTITSYCNKNNIDLSDCLIPVVPAEHYFMGGIKTDLSARTSINNLYAIGECASTGLHGANRLASNSLLECVIFSEKLSQDLCKNIQKAPNKTDENIMKIINKYTHNDLYNGDLDSILNNVVDKLKYTMTNNVGIERDNTSLLDALRDILYCENFIQGYSRYKTKKYFELRNSIIVAKAITNAAIARKNSIGAHYRTDYVLTSNNDIGNEIKVKNDEILVR